MDFCQGFFHFLKILSNLFFISKSQNMRLRHSSSPMGSTGSSNESWPSSKDEDMTEVYSHHNSTNAKHAKTSDSSEPDDVEEPNESWNEVSFHIYIYLYNFIHPHAMG